ncbi:hypothetical protein D3C73_1056270 [compost metagenome]
MNKNNNKAKFKENVFEILEIFEINIQHVGVVRSKMDVLNQFYDTQYSGAENEIKHRVMMLHIDFFGGMDFSARDSEENKILAEQLTKDIEEIKALLHKLEYR